MAPPTWATKDQTVFLTGHVPLYETYQATTRKYQPFWDMVNAEFLEKWPILAPEVNAQDLTEEAFQKYSKELATLYKRISTWYRWRCGSRARNTITTVSSKEIKEIYAPTTRNPKMYEIFVKQNPDLFQAQYLSECSRQGSAGANKLAIWHKVAGQLWEAATPEQKEAAEAQLAVTKEAKTSDPPDPSTPDEYQKYWERLPAILSKTVTPAVRKAGVLAFVAIVGPVPKAGGQILATTLQFGDKPDTPLFSTLWADHDRVLVDQLANFAGRYEFPPEICATRSLLHAQKTEDNTSEASGSGLEKEGEADVSGATSLEGSHSKSGSSPDGETPPGTTISSSNAPAEHTKDTPHSEVPPPNLSSASQSTGSSTSISTANVTSGAPVTQTTNDVNPISSNTTDFLEFEFTNMDFGNFDWANGEVFNMMSQTDVNYTLESHGSSVAMPFVQTPNLIGNTAPTHQPLVPNESSIAPPHVSTNTSQTSVPPAVNSPPVDTPVVNTAANALPPHVPIVNATNAAVNPLPVHAPVTNTASHASLHTSALAPNRSVGFQAPVPTVPATAPTPNVSTGETPFLYPPGSNTAGFHTIRPPYNLSTPPSTFTAVAPPSVAHASSVNAPAPTSPTIQIPGPTTVTAQPDATATLLHNSGAIVTTTPATTLDFAAAPPPTLQAPNLGTDFNQAQADQAPFNGLENGIRRSNRAPVPSTRLDRLNEIGNNIAPPKPLINSLATHVKPTWFDPAYEHLKRSDLGEAWTRLVEKWAEHECIKGWKAGKGLPAKGRPEEWSRFLSKARFGVRNYQSIPKVEDATEFGIAIVNWVKTFTPPDFGRTGPHGIVSLLTLLAWWGTAALTPPSWNDDSRPQWQGAIWNLLGKLDQHLNSPVPSKRASDDDNQDSGKENKRPRLDPLT